MATLSRAESKNMYSWWWDSHISPKNSRWLQENLTDMDSKVKAMIKVIEVDEDSFARRAEMYYKKRPELMKLVEEFYRAYRALAERYDHATGVIRQAHRTMAEHQVPFMMTDDGPVNLANDSDPRTPEMPGHLRPSFGPGESKGSDFQSVKANGDFTNGSNSVAGRKGVKQLDGFAKARKGLNFHEVEEKGAKSGQALSESERLGKSETDIQALKEALSKLEAEKEAGLLQYQQTLERLSKLESEVSQAKENSKGLNERASKAEAEVQSLKETLAKVEAEREASLLQYQQCLDRISNLEGSVSRAEQDAISAEKESDSLKEELSRLKAEKEALLAKYMEALERIANLENKLLMAEDYASQTNDRAERAEKEVENLRETIMRLTEEKEAAVVRHEQCLQRIAILEREIILIQEETERLKAEVQDGVAKLKGSEEKCVLLDSSNKSLQSEVESLVQKVGTQNQELSEKQKELGRLWTCVQEERMRFMDAETAYQSLQNLHMKLQEELRSIAAELQKKVQLLKQTEVQNQNLEDEIQKVKNENKGLSDLNLSSAASIENMQEEIFDLKEGKGKLEQELELRLNQRNTLQQEIYGLKEELNNLSQSHREAKDENAKLIEKLSVMEKLMEKNDLLEKVLSELRSELEGAREKVKALEESCHLLMREKSTLAADKETLVSQLQLTTEDLEKLSERNTFLENSLFDANAELEMLRVNSKNLEDSCRMLNDENSALISEKETLASQLETTHQRLEDLGRRHADLEERYSGLEEERESTLRRVEQLLVSLDVEKQEHANTSQLSQTRIVDLENQILQLQEVGAHMRGEFEEELDKAVNAQFDIFILRKCIQDLKDKNCSLLSYCEKLQEASKLSEKLISELENTSLEKQEEVKGLRAGMFQLLESLQTDPGASCEDQVVLQHILGKIDDIKTSLYEAWDENQELVIQKSVLISVLLQLKQDVADLSTITIILREEIGVRNEQLHVLQKEMLKLLESNEDLILKVREGTQKEVALLTEMDSLREKLFNLQGAYEDLQKENCKVVEDKRSLIKAFEEMEEQKQNLEHECSCVVGEAVALDNLSFVFKSVVSEKAMQVMKLTGNVEKLCNDNGLLEEKVRIVENELEEVRVENEHLKDEATNSKDLLCLREMELIEADAIKVNQENQILALSENCANQSSQISKMSKEYDESEARVGVLSAELQKGKDEVKLWETVAATIFAELQSTSVREALFKEKYLELIKEYEILEKESYSKGTDVVQLRERVGALEGENSETKARLADNLSAISSLRDSVASLEKHTLCHRKVHKTDDEEKEENSTEESVATSQPGESYDWQDVLARIRAVERAVIELKQTRQIELLKTHGLSRRGSGRFNKRAVSHPEEELRSGSTQPQKTKIADVAAEPPNELLMKDIMLDQVSDASSYGKNSRRMMRSDDQILELWETIDQGGGSIDLTVGKPNNRYPTLDAMKDNKSGRPSSEITIDKELCIDEQDKSRRFRNPQQEDYKRKTLERLASDVQKLTNLQITVQDLKEKVETTENASSSTKAKSVGVENDGIKDQLVETEETILKLFDYSAKLMKKIENSPSSAGSSFDGSSVADSVDSGRRRRSSEQARRISEKIGRLQVEVQKLQFLLMKLDNGKGSGKVGNTTRVTEWNNTRTLLRDYLYGGGSRTPRRRKRTHFCGCVRPPTKGD